MCEFCTKHGEGKKWYLNVKNYSSDLLSDVKRRMLAKDFFYWADKNYNLYFNIIKWLPLDIPLIGAPVRAAIKRIFINEHWGQIIPIEDVEKILSLTNSIVRVPCICRKLTTGKERRTCFLVSLSPNAIGMEGIIDQSFFGGPNVAQFEKFDKDSALNFIKEQERNGLVHSLWTVGTPFATGLCCCDNTGCIGMKMFSKKAPIFFKGEYIAKNDKDKCIGCKACIKVCQFGAIKFNVKIRIDARKCYGCGICRTVCKRNAIYLNDRLMVRGQLAYNKKNGEIE